ncbi:MAG: hypothetical protein HY744_00025 [Deltaproteobacteria bacterium]|nr:hypothetical protein [Deltaproteobacteria bacterium]
MRTSARLVLSLLLCSTLLAACSAEESTSTPTASSSGGASATGGSGGSAGVGGGGGVPVAVRLPQAVDGALLANPDVYDTVPLRIETEPPAASVAVKLGDTAVGAIAQGPAGTFVADLPIAGMKPGTVALAIEAAPAGADPTSLQAELVLSTTGVQLTDFAKVGFAGTPRIHRRGEELWLTWTDRSTGDAEAWLRRIDGAGRFLGEPVALVGDAEHETLYARTAFGQKGLGVLYQQQGQPYRNFFKLVDFDGKETMAPLSLDPEGWTGSFGGDVVFDGEAFVAVWRSHDGQSKEQVRWLRVEEVSQETTGPSVAAESGNEDPNGGFVPFGHVKVARVGEVSLVGFLRDRYDKLLQMAIPKSQLATVGADGSLVKSQYLGIENSLTFHWDARVFQRPDEAVAIWSASDLTSPEDNPPILFFGARSDAAGAMPIKGNGVKLFDAPDQRDDPVLCGHPSLFGVLAWTDHRAYTEDPAHGRIELYAAAVSDELAAEKPVVFPHARFIAGTSELGATALGTNVMLVWLDERHGGGIFDPRPEMWIETAWF